MINFIQWIWIICVFIGVIIAGIWLARITREELKDGRKWFRILIKLCLLFICIFSVYWIVSGLNILIVILSLAAFLIIAGISWKKSLKFKK